MTLHADLRCREEKASPLLDLYLPDRPTGQAFVFFHGGGLESGDKADDREAFEDLAAEGIAVVSANYRTYPNAAYPDFIEDAADAVFWAVQKLPSYGLSAPSLVVGGSSAGAYLSMMLAFDRSYLAKRMDDAPIRAFFFDSPQPTTHFNVLRERGLNPMRVVVDEASPLFHIDKPVKNVRYRFITSDDDIPCRYEQLLLTCRAMETLGYGERQVELITMRGYPHTGYRGHKTPDGKSLYASLVLPLFSEC